MTPVEILSVAKQRGILLEAEGDQIKYKAPTGTMTPDLIESVRSCKPDLLNLLNSNREHIKCIGAECTHTRYQNVDGSPWLWCGHIDKAVVHMMACPFDNWQKDAKGYPLPNFRE